MSMFPKEVYWQRRKLLRELVGDGLILFTGNEESAMNYKDNTYHPLCAKLLPEPLTFEIEQPPLRPKEAPKA